MVLLGLFSLLPNFANLQMRILTLLSIAFMASVQAFAVSAFDLEIVQRNDIDNGTWINFLPLPSAGAHGILMQNGTTKLPELALFGNGLSYSSGVITASMTKSFTTPARTLNTAYQPSASKDTYISVTVDVGATLSLTGGQTGTVTLEYADDSGITTNVKTVQSSVNGNTGTLTVGLSLTQTATCSLNGIIPAGKFVRIRTTNTTGTPTFTLRAVQEVFE